MLYFFIKNPLYIFNIGFILLGIIFNKPAYAQQRIDATMTVAGEKREFIVFKPSGTVPMGGYPLVFMLHGTNQDGNLFYNYSKWKEIAEREKFIVVFPTALVYCTTEGIVTKWSHGNTASVLCPGDTMRSDIPFFYKMIDTIAATIPINLKKIYATGFSSGGTMVPKLSIDMPGVFAAVGCGSGNLDDRDSFPMNPKVPTWAIRGTHDHGFLDQLGRPCPFNDSALLYNAVRLKNHLGSMGLTNQYLKDSTEYAIHYNFTKTLPGEAPAFFRWSIYFGLEHEYFNGSNYLSQLPNPPIEAELFWDFFKNVSILNSNHDTYKIGDLRCYPNPATQHMQIEFPSAPVESSGILRIFDVRGKKILEKEILEQKIITLDKSLFGLGVYLVQWQSKNHVYTQKILFQ